MTIGHDERHALLEELDLRRARRREIEASLEVYDHRHDVGGGLLRTAEARLAALGGVLELAGFSPRTLHGLDGDVLTRVFAVYRSALEDASPRQLSWAALRCPHGLDDVAEPHTAARHRSVIDTRSGLARSER